MLVPPIVATGSVAARVNALLRAKAEDAPFHWSEGLALESVWEEVPTLPRHRISRTGRTCPLLPGFNPSRVGSVQHFPNHPRIAPKDYGYWTENLARPDLKLPQDLPPLRKPYAIIDPEYEAVVLEGMKETDWAKAEAAIHDLARSTPLLILHTKPLPSLPGIVVDTSRPEADLQAWLVLPTLSRIHIATPNQSMTQYAAFVLGRPVLRLFPE